MSDTNEDEKTWLKKYDELAKRFSDHYLASKVRTMESMKKAMEKAREEIVSAKEFTVQQSEELKRFLQRDLEQTLNDFHQLSEDARNRLDFKKLEAGALQSIGSVLEQAGSALQEIGKNAKKALVCHTGEITSAGTLTCEACGETLHFERTARVPPCPKCKKTSFTKSL